MWKRKDAHVDALQQMSSWMETTKTKEIELDKDGGDLLFHVDMLL
jgi:hypothetical protein